MAADIGGRREPRVVVGTGGRRDGRVGVHGGRRESDVAVHGRNRRSAGEVGSRTFDAAVGGAYGAVTGVNGGAGSGAGVAGGEETVGLGSAGALGEFEGGGLAFGLAELPRLVGAERGGPVGLAERAGRRAECVQCGRRRLLDLTEAAATALAGGCGIRLGGVVRERVLLGRFRVVPRSRPVAVAAVRLGGEHVAPALFLRLAFLGRQHVIQCRRDQSVRHGITGDVRFRAGRIIVLRSWAV
ncbi:MULTISPECIES: hypothetical protein [Catenuloplanes]|uniref:Uncharacterized protein n=1 Tax=Catenuloplanes niger TaxID=587534 RepID=A0AAE3ZS45_9ACTN|nr:hypothetical protein [Catenuloplanes niger]MDR7322860.1 hypothetical protein [Catenuloplanes niger]